MNKATKEELQMYLNSGWTIYKDTEESIIVERNRASLIGHVIIFLIVGWWLLCILNIIYHYSNRERVEFFK